VNQLCEAWLWTPMRWGDRHQEKYSCYVPYFLSINNFYGDASAKAAVGELCFAADP
jgi:hypothetical protein